MVNPLQRNLLRTRITKLTKLKSVSKIRDGFFFIFEQNFTMENICLECGTRLYGRFDKKFCNDQCRNNYNNKQNRDETAIVKTVNRTLRKNRRILKELNPNGKAKIKRKQLDSRGFDFKYFTNVYKTKEGKVYYFCYEYGYLPLDNSYFALVLNKEI